MTLEKITGTIDKVTFYSPDNGFFIIKVLCGNKNITVKGNCSKQPTPGAGVVIDAREINDPKWGKQYQATAYKESLPEKLTGVISFLTEVEGVGVVIASKLARAIHNSQKKLTSLVGDLGWIESNGIKPELAKRIHDHILAKSSAADVEVDLAAIGLGPKSRQEAIKAFGIKTLQKVLETDPYKLISIPRISFKKVDKWAISTGRLAFDCIERAAAVACAAIEANSMWGHTYADIETLLGQVGKLDLAAPCPLDMVRKGIDKAVSEKTIVKVGKEDYALAKYADAEDSVAKILSHWMSNNTELGSVSKIDKEIYESLTEEQKQAVENAINHRVSILTGGPGTGKTFCTKAIVHAMHGAKIQIVAPTGKAAKRVSELTGIKASTIHRFIGSTESKILYPKDTTEVADPDEVIPQFILVDESSMVDISLMANLLRLLNLRKEARLVVVGDVNQLPSISPGRTLGDLIDCGMIPTTTLTKIQRQKEKSMIIKNANIINDGLHQEQLFEGSDFEMVICQNPLKLREQLVNYISKSLPEQGYNFIDDVQVLVGQRTSEIGVEKLNGVIREVMNPEHPNKREYIDRFGNVVFRVGDRVLVTENSYELNVVNGDQGIVTNILTGFEVGTIKDQNHPSASKISAIEVTIDGNRVLFQDEDMMNLTQAWAMTVHKSQGSEYKLAIVICHETMRWALQRSLLYTAVTRGKEKVVLFGTDEAVSSAISNETPVRYTRLYKLLPDIMKNAKKSK